MTRRLRLVSASFAAVCVGTVLACGGGGSSSPRQPADAEAAGPAAAGDRVPGNAGPEKPEPPEPADDDQAVLSDPSGFVALADTERNLALFTAAETAERHVELV